MRLGRYYQFQPETPLELVLNIHAAALARITLAKKGEIRDGLFVIHDSLPKLEEKAPLPVRPEV